MNTPENQSSLLHFDEQVFRDGFNEKPFTIQHELSGHPLFALPRLIELSQALPQHRVEYNSGKLPLNQDPKKTPRTGLSIQETIERIENCSSWLVLKNVELDSTYKALLDELLDEVMVYSEPLYPGMCHREGFIFISSPGSVTPCHIDPEHNFLLQVRGLKTVCMWDKQDRVVVSENQVEEFYAGAHRNITYTEEFEQRGVITQLKPGEGLHFPVTAPHWVKNGPEVSISFSITFRTQYSERRARIYQANATLRHLGISPSPYGRSAISDSAKDLVFRVARKTRKMLGGSDAERSAY